MCLISINSKKNQLKTLAILECWSGSACEGDTHTIEKLLMKPLLISNKTGAFKKSLAVFGIFLTFPRPDATV